MYKLIFMMLFAAVSINAMADWVKIGESNEISSNYADPATIRKDGNMVQMWDMTDFKTAQTFNGVVFMSLKSQSQYDCKEEQIRELSENGYSGSLGAGKSVLGFGIREWHPVKHHSTSEALLELACGRK